MLTPTGNEAGRLPADIVLPEKGVYRVHVDHGRFPGDALRGLAFMWRHGRKVLVWSPWRIVRTWARGEWRYRRELRADRAACREWDRSRTERPILWS